MIKCDCMTKTPDPSYHTEKCKYRVWIESVENSIENNVPIPDNITSEELFIKWIRGYGNSD